MSVVSTTAISISVSWTSAGSLVAEYLVTWHRNTSGECPDTDGGTITITDGSTAHTITDVEENSEYNINVRASNAASSFTVSNSVTATTSVAGKELYTIIIAYRVEYIFISSNSCSEGFDRV